MHRHHKDPVELRQVAQQFAGGQFILKEGQGSGTVVLSGKVSRVEVPDLTAQKLVIHCEVLYRRKMGCNDDFSRTARWEPIATPPGGIPVEYSWFYLQPTQSRLKLESVPHNERCWLCSYETPMHLDLFRAMLWTMFLKENLRKASALQEWLRRVRNRIVLVL